MSENQSNLETDEFVDEIPESIPEDTEFARVIEYAQDEVDPTVVSAYNIEVTASSVINHYVLEGSEGAYVCAGISFPDGHYEHLEESIPETQVLKHVFEN